MDVVQEFLGHTKPAMTRRYAKMNTDKLKLALRRTREGAIWRRNAELFHQSNFLEIFYCAGVKRGG